MGKSGEGKDGSHSDKLQKKNSKVILLCAKVLGQNSDDQGL